MKTLILVAIAAFFFPNQNSSVNHSNERSRLMGDYYYTENTDDPSAENNAENWEVLDDQAAQCPGNSNVLCTITAPQGPDGHPDFTGIEDIRNSPEVQIQSFKP